MSTSTSPAARPGYKTTEFWLSTIAQLLGILMASGAVGEGTTLERVIGVIAAVLASMGYSVARGKAKSNVSGVITSVEAIAEPLRPIEGNTLQQANGVRSLVIALLLPALLFSGGCGATPRAQWAEQRQALTAAQDALVELHGAGVISDEQLLDASRVALAVRVYLAEAANHFDNETAFERLMGHAEAGMAALQQYLTPAEDPSDGRSDAQPHRGADEGRHGLARQRAHARQAAGRNHRRAVSSAAGRGGQQRCAFRPGDRVGEKASFGRGVIPA